MVIYIYFGCLPSFTHPPHNRPTFQELQQLCIETLVEFDVGVNLVGWVATIAIGASGFKYVFCDFHPELFVIFTTKFWGNDPN